jgi:hypothetical protein
MSNKDEENDDEVLGKPNAIPEDEDSRWVHLLASIVCTNHDYGLGPMVPLLDTSAIDLASSEAVELHAQTFVTLCFLVHARGFSEEDPAIYFGCCHWKLTAPFLRYNYNG